MREILSGFFRVMRQMIWSKTFVWSVTGALVVTDVVYYTMKWRRPQRAGTTTIATTADAAVASGDEDNKLYNVGNITSVRHYWTQLSNAILTAPHNSFGDRCRRFPPSSMAGEDDSTMMMGEEDAMYTEAIRIIWEDRVRYCLDEREVLLLLRRVGGETRRICEDDNNDDEIISTASLALLWRLELVRCVHEALFVSEDVSQCSSELSDLDDYSNMFYKQFIHPLGKSLQHSSASLLITSCWHSLTEDLHSLRRQKRLLQLRNMWSLVKFLYVGGREKLLSCTMMSLLSAIVTHSTSTGLGVRKQIEELLGAIPRLFFMYGGGSSETSSFRVIKSIVSLLAFEWARLITTTAMLRVTEDYINTSASRHRDRVKERLYEALVNTPLSFFDTRDPDDVESLIYYVNDLEGVDVQVHELFTRLLRDTAILVAAMATLDRYSSVLVMATVAGSNILKHVLSMLRKKCVVDTEEGDNYVHFVDAEEEENGNVATDGMLLRGMEIIEYIHELRPYGVDTSLMRWWVKNTRLARWRNGAIFRASRVVLYQHRLWIIDALITLTEWLLPVIIATQARGLFVDAMHAIQELCEHLFDVPAVAEVVMQNAYKASALERVLDSSHWEENVTECRMKTTEMYTVKTAPGEGEEGENDGTVIITKDRGREFIPEKRKKRNNNDNDMWDEDAEVEILRVRADGLQFQYPTAPTVNAFLSPASFCAQLQDELTGEGRLVCVAGQSGCGKTTLLRLLLHLYTTEPKRLMLQVRHHRGHTTNTEQNNNINNSNSNEEGTCWFAIEDIPCSVLRSRLFSYVPQVAVLFPGASIAQNITLQSHVSIADHLLLAKVRDCAEAAACMDFISRLPQGLLTPVSPTTGRAAPGAVRLSCGHGRRLMLARALFHGGGVLLMDEPTAGLDAGLRGAVISQLRELLRSRRLRGVVCVTHDEEVLRSSDEVIQL